MKLRCKLECKKLGYCPIYSKIPDNCPVNEREIEEQNEEKYNTTEMLDME